MGSRDFLLMLALSLAFSSRTMAADSSVFISVAGSPIRLETFVYLPATDGKFPVIIFNHGSSGGKPRASFPARRVADYFVERGFVVVVPMRRGRGQSSGVSPEPESKNCDPESWSPGLQLSSEDLSAVFEYLNEIPEADPSAVILAGASRGGFLSVAYAADGKYRKDIVGVINFVGGWTAQAEYQCGIDFNYVSYAKYGAKTRIPMLWLYGANDAFYADKSIDSYHRVFAAKGGNVRFRMIHNVPRNGHWLPGYPALWAKPVNFFLASIKTSSPDS